MMERLDRWLANEYATDPAALSLFRIAFGFYLLVFAVPDWLRAAAWLAELPSPLIYPPPGPFLLLDSFPPTVVVWSTAALMVVASVGVLLGAYTRASSLVLGMTIIVLDGILFSLGKIDHGRILLFITPLVLAFSPWGEQMSVDAGRLPPRPNGRERTGFSLALLALFVGFAMFSAAPPKVVGGWLDTSTQAAYGHLFENFHINGRRDLLARLALSSRSTLFWEIQDWVTVVFEAGFLLAVARRRVFKLFCAAAVLFHLGVLLVLNISFVHQLIVYAAFLPLGRWFSVPDHGDSQLTPRAIAIVLVSTVAASAAIQLGFDGGGVGGIPASTWTVYFVAVVAVLAAGWEVVATRFTPGELPGSHAGTPGHAE